MKILGIIPARYASTRFPGKPLALIAGKTMIQRVYKQVLKAKCLSNIIVATDDERIFDHVVSFGGQAVMTSKHHSTGTERCLEASKKLSPHNEFDVIINIQGDEPLINPIQIDKLAACFKINETQIATLGKALTEDEDKNNPNIVKLVTDKAGKALYFSRYPIPYIREKEPDGMVFYKHLGLYAFNKGVLDDICNLKPTLLEKAESLEQLRWLENGYCIRVVFSDSESLAVDTPEDILKVENFIKASKL
ncbi:MAG: 3-deoxy-manno-octulosonate cytidylyltransferase [Bacteroidetes bacterium ADurb.Bin408]|nr:MAG: 3-deoxy-manno-octulosonate cytidylyltransferase [Bacteroidetes bacterium ADurb.Bin408]